MRRLTWLAGLAAVSAVHVTTSAFAAPSTVPLLEHLPVAFEANVGQHDGRVEFVARGAGHTLFLTRGEAALTLRTRETGASPLGRRLKAQRPDPTELHSVLHMRFDGGNAAGGIEGVDRLPGTLNVFSGSDPHAWRRGVPQYASVRQKEIYPGIDVIYHGDGRRLAYDLVVAPDADPARIALAFDGVNGLALARNGDLIILVKDVSIRHRAPIAYQEIDGKRRAVASRFILDGAGRVTFELGAYDRTQPLVIDPTLVYATFAGGSDTDSASAIAIDAAGAVYIAGQTTSSDFPAAGAPPPTIASGDVFVAKLNAEGTAFLHTTILGGSSYDFATGIAVDSGGQIWIAGATGSADFPILNGFRTTFRASGDAFLLRLDPSGALVYSTYLGADFASAIAVAPSGPGGSTQVFITGATNSTDLPILNAFQPTFGGGGFGDLVHGDAFVMKLDAGGNPLYATYLGGSDDDAGTSIAADAAGNAYVTGLTASMDFPVVSAVQSARAGGGMYNYDLFVAKLNPLGSALVYSSYLGGSAHELGAAINVDSAGRAVIAGCSLSEDFPTRNALQAANAGGLDAIVAKLTADGSAFVFSTYLGGEGSECGVGVAIGPNDDIFIVGTTTSVTFPLQLALNVENNGSYDAFVTRLASDGSRLIYSTYYGGGGEDWGAAIAVDANGAAYVAGMTLGGGPPYGPWFPTTAGSAQPTVPGRGDAFVLKIDPNTPPTITNPGDQVGSAGVTISLPIGASDPDGDTVVFTATGLPPGLAINATTGVISGTLSSTTSGEYVVTVAVNDDHGGVASTAFHWTVTSVNRSPVLDPIGNKTVQVGTTLSFIVTASDPDGDTLTFTADPLLANATFEAPTFTFTPVASQIGTYNSVTFRVSDGRGGSASETVVIRVARTIALAITAPIGGATVPAGTLIVRGTVDSAGEDVGVAVNGFVAGVAGGIFAVQVPVTSDVPTLTATATSPNGGSGTVTINVTVFGEGMVPVLSASPSSGAAPLSVGFAVPGVTPTSITLDLDGDGSVDFAGSTLTGQRFIYSEPGLYFPRATVTDAAGGQFLVTTIVHVESAVSVEARFSALWAAFKTRLQAGDISGALDYLSPDIRPDFEVIFQALGPDLPLVAPALGDVVAIEQVGDLAETVIVKPTNGRSNLYFIYFRRDDEGRWLIEEM